MPGCILRFRSILLVVYTSTMYIAILGRQPALGMAELEQLFGSECTSWFGAHAARVDAHNISVEQLGGSQKIGRVVAELTGNWRHVSMQLVRAYTDAWATHEGKMTLGISAYGFDISTRDVQKTAIILKQKLRDQDVSLRVIPNTDIALNTATSHHNKLGLADNKVELLVVREDKGRVIIAESIGAQNITALASRDQARPRTDAFVGMLPPKLARMMVNMLHITPTAPDHASADDAGTRQRILDPFCGTGTLLQEAALLGYAVYGTDLSEKMVRYSRDNLNWLQNSHRIRFDWYLHEGDAMHTSWQQPLDAIACETYLGQPFSAPPSPAKLQEVRGNCNHIITEFLKNLAPQLSSGTPLCIAVPAWRDARGQFTHLPFIQSIEHLGYRERTLVHVQKHDLLYYRDNQVVGRELLLLEKS